MSATNQPISPARFASALQELPLSSLHSTAAEIRNSQVHLETSNRELRPYADEGDAVCKEAIDENAQVLERMKARLDLLKAEVLRRGMPWVEDGPVPDTNGHISTAHDPESHGEVPYSRSSETGNERSHRRSSPEEEARRTAVEEYMQEQDEDDSEGVHL